MGHVAGRARLVGGLVGLLITLGGVGLVPEAAMAQAPAAASNPATAPAAPKAPPAPAAPSAGQSTAAPNAGTIAPRAVPTQAGAASATPAGGAGKVCTVNTDADPDAISEPLAVSRKLYRERKLDEALAAYDSIFQVGGAEAAAAYAGAARVLLAQNDPASAYDAAQKALALTPDGTAAMVAMGEVLFRQGKIPEAQAAFMKPLKNCMVDARAFLGLYRVYAISLNWKRAKTNIDQAYKLDPEDPEIANDHNRTISLAERIRALQGQLDAADVKYDDKEKDDMKQRLEKLKAWQAAPAVCRVTTTNVTATETELEPMLDQPGHVRGYGLTMNINGAPARLRLDTGASGISIDQNLAAKAGVKKLVDTTIGGIGDEHDVASYIGTVEKIRIGNLEFANCQVYVLKERQIVGEDGLIGADVFRNFLIDINMPKHKLKLSQLPPYPDQTEQALSLGSSAADSKYAHDRYFPPEMNGYTGIFLSGHDMLIPTTVNSSAPKLFLIDTGAFDNQLSVATAREVTKVRTDYDNYGTVKGVSGKVKTLYRAEQAVLQFANFKQDRSDLFAFDLSHISFDSGTEISGILGFQMLFELEMKIDYRDGLVKFSADERFRASDVDVFNSR